MEIEPVVKLPVRHAVLYDNKLIILCENVRCEYVMTYGVLDVVPFFV